MTLREYEDIENWNKMLQFAPCGELVLEQRCGNVVMQIAEWWWWWWW